MVSDSVSRDWLSAAVSVPAVLVVRSLTASVSEYGDEVRDIGMTSSRSQPSAARGLQGQHPLAQQRPGADVRGGLRAERNLALDGERDQRLAVVCSETSETEPTLMPDTVTSLPTVRPPASVNSA